jgi:hypothetical protein
LHLSPNSDEFVRLCKMPVPVSKTLRIKPAEQQDSATNQKTKKVHPDEQVSRIGIPDTRHRRFGMQQRRSGFPSPAPGILSATATATAASASAAGSGRCLRLVGDPHRE